MKKTSWLYMSLSLIVFLVTLGLWDVAQGNTNLASQVPENLPENLQVPTEQQLLLKAAARGSQIYVCEQLVDKKSQFEWTLEAPDAKLFNSQGQVLGNHYEGPTWEANDGSKVTADIKATENAPNASIPWFLLQVESSQGDGRLANVEWIQRLHTTGGIPQQNCDRNRQNAKISVPYTADYYFYSPIAR